MIHTKDMIRKCNVKYGKEIAEIYSQSDYHCYYSDNNV